MLVLIGCAEAPGPRVALSAEEPLPEYVEAAQAWEAIDFTVELGTFGDMPECSRHWYQNDETDCQITITIARIETRETYGTDALSNISQRAVAIDWRIVDRAELMTATAHEVGHILLDTHRHTRGGIMGGQGWKMFAPWPDKQLACMTIRRGC